MLEAAGKPVALVQGAEDNIKLTLPEDLVRLERLLGSTPLPRTGLGYDVHAFEAGRPLILCGITIPHDRGLQDIPTPMLAFTPFATQSTAPSQRVISDGISRRLIMNGKTWTPHAS